MSPDLAIPASPAALRNEGSGFLPLTAKAASFSGIGYVSGSGETLCMGQYQGGFALCTVMSGEFLDGSLRRIDPFRVTEPMLVYVRVTSEASSGPTMSVDVRSERAGKAIVTPKVRIDLPRCGVSGIYQAPLLLIPEACSAGPSSGGPSPLASLSVPLGEGHLWATAPAGNTLASADTAFPAVLRLRFLTRDGSQLTPPDIPASPEMTGMTQQTAIGDSSDSYAESVWVEVRAENPFDWTQLQDTGVSVGIAEMANDRYQGTTKRFFVGTLGSTLLDESGKVGGEKGGSFLSLDHGKARQRLSSVAERRLDALSGEPDPFLPYAGSRGAQLRPLPEAFIAGPADPREGPVLGVSLWVDEGTYNRRRDDVPVVPGVESYWARSPNTVRDWLEKKAWDVWADTQDDPSGQVNEMCRIPTQLVEDVSQVYAGAVSTSFPTIVKFNPMFRDIRCPSLAGNPWTIHYYGFYEKKPADGFPVIALHEARHCFQLSWVSRGAVDEDGDLLYAPNSCVTADSAELFDKPNRDDPRSGGFANGDGHFKGDGPGLADGGDAKRTMWEHEAMRFVNRTGSSLELACALSGFTLRSSAELSGLAGSVLPGGVLVEVTAKRSQQATLIDEPRSGVTVRFTVPEASTALVNGAKRAWVMTSDAGQASVEITNGAAGSTTEITVDMLPPMAPQDQCTRYPFVTSLKVTLHAQ